MLIKSSRTVGIPRIQFACHSQMYKPVHLNCLPVSLRFVSRHNTAVFCNLKKFCLSFFFCACSCKFFGILCIVLCKNHDRITGNIHAFQFSFFIKGFRIIHIIQFFKGKLDICLMPQKAFIIDVFWAYCMTRSSLFHKFGKHTCFICIFPLRSHMCQYLMPDWTILPVWNHFLFLKIIVLLFDCKIDQFPVIHDFQILYSMAAKIRECRCSLRVTAFFTNDQFAITYV